jgi:VIT1/CCC1 family predicted Fe2+/Mn2+ transporter
LGDSGWYDSKKESGYIERLNFKKNKLLHIGLYHIRKSTFFLEKRIIQTHTQFEQTKDMAGKLENLDNYLDPHYIQRSNWLRAAVLGANDGILSTASLAIGVAAASDLREPVILATLAGLVAGALSMAAGEYVSVSSQTDVEKADIEREKIELKEMPELELQRLAEIYEKRGLKKETALKVAKELTEKDALGAHIRDELGINEMSQAKPIQAAIASGAAFTIGGVLPLLVTLFLPLKTMEYSLYGFALFFLIILGALAAKTGGSNIWKAILRITFWGTVAMGLTALVGYLFNVNLS